MQKIGIICACEEEFAPFLPHIEGAHSERRGLLTIHTGSIGRQPVAALYCGVCRVNAAIAAQLLIDAYRVDAILNAGTAGGIAPEVALFDTVVGTRAAYHDVEGDILTSFFPYLPDIWFHADARLLAAAKRAAAGRDTVRFGPIVTGEAFITDARRDALYARFAPLAVDMETAGIAHACCNNGVAFLAVRSITDTATHEGLGAFEQNCRQAAARSKDFVLALLECEQGME